MFLDVKFEESDPRYHALLEVNPPARKEQYHWIKSLLTEKEANLHTTLESDATAEQSPHQLGQLFGFSRALCHNDLLAGKL